MDHLLRSARAFNDPDQDASLMPLRAIRRSTGTEATGNLSGAVERFENRLARDAARQAHLRACEERMLEVPTTNVERHFEELTGHSLADMPMHQRGAGTGRRRAALHVPSRNNSRRPLARMRAGSAVLACIMLVFVGTLGSYDRDPLSDALGDALVSESVLFGNLGQTTRGGSDTNLEERKAKVRAALDLIDQARTSILGFHTGYEPSALRRAADLIDSAAWSVSPVEPGTAELYRLRDEIRRLLTEEGHDTSTEAPPLSTS